MTMTRAGRRRARAWLAGNATSSADVLIEVDATAGSRPCTAGRCRRRRATPALRCRGLGRCPGWPTRTRTRSTGRCAAARTADRRQLLDLARPDVRGRRPARPGQLLRAGPGGLRRDGPGRHHLRRRVPLPAPRPGRHPYADPNAMGARPDRGRREAGIRITLLDTLYLTSSVDGKPLEGVQRRFGDGDCDGWADARRRAAPRPRHARIGAAAALGAGGAGRRYLATFAGGPRAAGARAPLRAARRERAVPGRARLHPHRAARPARRLGPRDHRGARHPPVRRRLAHARRHGTGSASARPPNATWPTASGRPGALADAGARSASAATATR